MLPGSAIPEEDIRIFGHLCGESRLCEFVRCGLDMQLECQYFNQRLVQCHMDCPSFGHPSLKAVKCDDIDGIPTWRKLGYDMRISKYLTLSVTDNQLISKSKTPYLGRGKRLAHRV